MKLTNQTELKLLQLTTIQLLLVRPHWIRLGQDLMLSITFHWTVGAVRTHHRTRQEDRRDYSEARQKDRTDYNEARQEGGADYSQSRQKDRRTGGQETMCVWSPVLVNI